MTTRIEITNKGPENAVVWYYNEQRLFTKERTHLAPGESVEIDVWDGKLPVVLPTGHVPKDAPDAAGGHFYSVPPATY